MKTFIKFVFIILLLQGHNTAFGVAVFNFDFIFAGSSEQFEGASETTGISFKSNTTLFFGDGEFRYGGLVQYEAPSENSIEYIVGILAGIGSINFLEIGGGYLKRDFGSYTEEGYAGMIKIGRHFSLSNSLSFRLSIPFIYKKITSGLVNKTIYNYIPYIGLGFKF